MRPERRLKQKSGDYYPPTQNSEISRVSYFVENNTKVSYSFLKYKCSNVNSKRMLFSFEVNYKCFNVNSNTVFISFEVNYKCFNVNSNTVFISFEVNYKCLMLTVTEAYHHILLLMLTLSHYEVIYRWLETVILSHSLNGITV